MASSVASDDEGDGFTCFWKIEDFTLCEKSTDLQLKSQSFDVNMLHSKWSLNCRREENFMYVCLFNESPAGYRSIKYSFTILQGWDWYALKTICKDTFKAGGKGHGLKIVEWNKLFNFKDVYLPNDSLIIKCCMWNTKTEGQSAQCLLTSRMLTATRLQHFRIQKYCSLNASDFIFSSKVRKVKNKSTQTDLTTNDDIFDDKDDLLRLFTEKRFCYVTLRTLNKDFAVHKALLCARSPVFCTMFDKDLKENKSNIVDVDDVDSETLKLFLQFLHLEPIGELEWEEAVRLYYAADKYQVEKLKNVCILQLKKRLTVENVCEVFELSDIHQNKELKQCAQEFFCENSKTILRSKEWSRLLLNRTELAGEILFVLAEKL